MPCDFCKLAGVLQIGCRAGCAALRHHVSGAAFALATLGRNAQFKLDLVKAHAGASVAGNFAVRDTVTNADDHGLACWLDKIIQYCQYKCESVAFAITLFDSLAFWLHIGPVRRALSLTKRKVMCVERFYLYPCNSDEICIK